MITPERAQLSAALAQVIDGLVGLVVAGVVERLQPQRGELVAVRTAPASSEPASRPGAPSDLLTIAEAATLLNVAKNTVAGWVWRTRELPHVSLGTGGRSGRRLCRIRRADVDAFVAHEQPPGPRGSSRKQALELLATSEQRSELRRRRRLERVDAPPKWRAQGGRVGPQAISGRPRPTTSMEGEVDDQ